MRMLKTLRAARKTKTHLLIIVAAVLALPFAAAAAVLVNDTFADGNSTVQNLAANSIRIFKGRSTTTRTDAVGAVAFDMTATGGNSEAFWGYFTNSDSPVNLAVGDKLTVSGTFSLTGFVGTGQDVRFGVLNSLGTRNANDLTGGMNDATFAGDPGYALGFFASGSGSPFVIYRRTNLNVNNVFNTFGDFTAIPGAGAVARQPLTNNTPYTLVYTIERLSATETRIVASVTGGALNNLNFTSTESSATPNTAFDYFAFRVGGANFAQKITFTNWKIDYTPSVPVITIQPQPNNLTVQVGSNVTMSVAASGNSLSYQWQRNGVAVANNPSATMPTLNLSNVQLSDAGSYTALVSNPGGSTTSNPVTLNVSVDPVPPPPSITQQPADTTAPVGTAAALTVAADGDNLFYQWFKNGALVPGATGAALNFASLQTADAANYTVVVSNSSGSVTSLPARLLVVSTMQAAAFAPANFTSNVDIDAPLYLTFNQPPTPGTTGRLRVYTESGALVDTLDMSASTQSRLNGTVSFNYRPIITSGNTAAIYLHQKLAYNTSYYVTMEPGVIRDAAGAPFVGFDGSAVWNFSTKTSGPAAGATALTVASDGTGDFATVQGAVDFVPANNNKRVVIFVKKGAYTEIVYVNSNKPFITVRGEDRNLSVIQYANNNNFNPTSTTTRTMFGVDAPDFTLENITLRNTTPQGGSQAEAFRGNNNRIVLNKVSLYSFQDTLLLQGQSNQGGFVTDSYIEGDVDFVWGSGAVFFKNTELKMMLRQNNNAGVYAQFRNPQGRNGYVFVNCRLTRATAGVTNTQLHRIDPDDFPYSQMVLIDTVMDAHIRPDPWQFDNPGAAVNAANYPNIRMWEYKSRDTGGNLVDVSQRHPISRQLTDAEAAQWSDPSFVLGGWTPQTKLTAAVSLSNLAQNFTGAPAVVTATTEPANLVVAVTYNGSPTPPSAIGSYSVVATINDPNYRGGTSATLTIYAPGAQPLRAFPGAEGAGANAVGGRGGDVYHVANLNDSGAGSLREGIRTATGPRTIVFDVAGTINLATRLNVNKSYLTLAGQTAPGDGVTIAGHSTVVTGSNIIIRYLRFRMGDANCPAVQDDALWVDKSTDVILDHVSASWSVDETLSVTESNRVTVQWSFITESMKNSCHEKGAHGYGSLIRYGAGLVTYHHNLYAHHDSRNPRVGDNIGLDFVNNVIYNWGGESSYSGPADEGTTRVNYVGNYLVAGPQTAASKLRAFSGGSVNTQIYQSNNFLDGDKDGTRDGADNGWAMFINAYTRREPARFEFPQVTTHDAPKAYELVLNTAGHSRSRDAVDTRVGGEVRNEGGRHINSQNEVGGYPVLNTAAAPADTDGDGIPDEWETARGLNPADAADGRAATAGGYTNLERYLNGIVPVPGVDANADMAAPVAVATLSAEPNAAGWHNADVTVTINAADNEGGAGLREIVYAVNGVYGFASASPVTIPVTSEGATTVTYYAGDRAGNSGAAQMLTVKLDKTAPSIGDITHTPANAAGWNNTDVVASYHATDNGSGFGDSPDESGAYTFSNEGAGQSFTFQVTDLAGNSATATVADVNIDKTAPVISATRAPEANTNGWNNTDVVAAYTAGDALSGLAADSPDAGAHTFNTEGAGQSHTFTVEDLAGNTATATVSGVSIDKTAPVVNLLQPIEGAFYFVGQTALADYNCADNLAGLAACAGTTPSGAQFDTAAAGPKTFGVSATDLAGNTAAKSVAYTVGYNLALLYNAGKTHQSGSTIPFKLQLLDSAGANRSNASIVLRVVGVSPVGSNKVVPANSPGNSNPDSVFTYDAALGGYHFNLKTTGLAPGAYRLHFTAGADPHVYTAQFQIK